MDLSASALVTPDKLKTRLAVTFFVTERIDLRPRGGRRWSWMNLMRKRLKKFLANKKREDIILSFNICDEITR
ncbi:hypothetical protein HLI_02635 [Halobacillus litoralis]|uniref:Uncharacterized protein n=1 Tax=Halobacillus litoralis TaxID=45668 RepID=A0A410M8Z6_9BACI|nr:hypothetical protein HLI_02635 [Halobacillus litoralis]